MWLQRCDSCRRYSYPPSVACSRCGGGVTYEAIDGAATLSTWSLSYVDFGPGLEVPYVLAIVAPDVEPDLQVMTNLVNVRVGALRIAMAVEPLILHHRERSLLFYQPATLKAKDKPL